MDTKAEAELSAAELRDLSTIAGTMVPEDLALGMPGADDPTIMADLAGSLGRDLPMVREAVAAIAVRSGGAFAGMDRAAREALINDYYTSGGAAAAALGRVILAAYYRDDRVLRALGLEARPPFPKGHVVEPRDWSLLDPVRRRPDFWRDDRKAPEGGR
jgi:hypothetical protein